MEIPQSLWESYPAFSYTSGRAIVLGPDESEDGESLPMTDEINARGYRNLRCDPLVREDLISVSP